MNTTEKEKFLFIAPRLHPNQYGWVKALLDNGHEVEFWQLKQVGKSAEDAPIMPIALELSWVSKIIPQFWKSPKRWFEPSSHTFFPKIIPLYKKFKEYKPDIVIGRDPHTSVSVFVSFIIARLQGSKVVAYSMTPLHKKTGFFGRIFTDLFLKTFSAVWITPVLGDKNNHPKKFHKSAYFVSLVAEAQDAVSEKSNDGKIRIISVSKLGQARKNNLLLLQALNSIKDKVDFHLLIIGHLKTENNPVYKELINYTKENNLQNRVGIRINMSHKEVLKEYKNHELFILPSSDEPFGYSVLEAMAAGLPVICSDSTGVQWYIQEGENGYVFKSGSAKDLARKMLLVVSDKKGREKMSKANHRLGTTTYGAEAFYNQLTENII